MSRYHAYAEYKDSGVEWLGNLPAHSEFVQLKYVAELAGTKIGSNTTTASSPNAFIGNPATSSSPSDFVGDPAAQLDSRLRGNDGIEGDAA